MPISGYINSKYLAQQYMLEQVEHAGLPAVIVNPTFMIGPNDVEAQFRQVAALRRRQKHFVLSAGREKISCISRTCAAGSSARSGKGKNGGLLFAGRPEPQLPGVLQAGRPGAAPENIISKDSFLYIKNSRDGRFRTCPAHRPLSPAQIIPPHISYACTTIIRAANRNRSCSCNTRRWKRR